jgi:hypothetical protein
MRPPHARIHPLEQASNSFGRESAPDALQWRWDFFGGEKNFSLEKKRVHTGRQRAASAVEAVHWIRLTIQLVQWIDFTLHIVAPHFCLLWGKWNAAWLTALAPLARAPHSQCQPALQLYNSVSLCTTQFSAARINIMHESAPLKRKRVRFLIIAQIRA